MMHIGEKKPKAWAGALLMGAMTVATFSVAEAAQAFTWDDNSVTFDLYDAGSSVDVFYFDGYINEQLVEGLTSSLKLELLSFDGLNAMLKGVITNTMDSDVFDAGRVTGIAFNVDPDVIDATSDGVLSEAVLNGNFPGGVKTVNVCYTNGNTCGGSKSGVKLGETGEFYTTLTWGSMINSFTLSDFFARYQGLDYASTTRIEDESGIGVGTVPTPALIPSLLGMALAARRGRKGQSSAEQDAEVVEQVA